jgi:hypothetical protein
MDEDGHLLDDADPPTDAGGWFWAALPYSPEARAVVIARGDEVLMRLEHTPNAPTVRFEEPARAGAGGPIRIAWDGEDADGDEVGYALQYSPDGERGWRYLTPPWTHARSYRLDPASMPEGPRPTLRVLATDGFRSAEATMPMPRGL